MSTATTNTGVAVRGDTRLSSIRELLDKSKNNLRAALPMHISPDYMVRVVLTSVQRTPELLECHPITLLGAVYQAAQLGLVPDGVLGQAYLVPFNNRQKRRKEVQFIPGYKGLIALARRSGEVPTIGAEVVHEKDKFVYKLGLNTVLDHVPTDDDDPGPIVKVYAYAKLKDGGEQIVVMNRRQVDAIRSRSQAAKSTYSPWTTDPDWMWKKTALKQLCKLLPASIELQRAVGLEESAEVGIPQDLSLLLPIDIAPDEAPTPHDPNTATSSTATADTAKLSDVMMLGAQIMWDQPHITAFIKERFGKDPIALAPGAECFNAMEAMRLHAENIAADAALAEEG